MPKIHVLWEIEIEDLLSHLIGVLDAMLGRINEKLSLGLDPKEVNLSAMKNKLRGSINADLLNELSDLLDRNLNPNGNWLLKLRELRNLGMQRNILNIKFAVHFARKSKYRTRI